MLQPIVVRGIRGRDPFEKTFNTGGFHAREFRRP